MLSHVELTKHELYVLIDLMFLRLIFFSSKVDEGDSKCLYSLHRTKEEASVLELAFRWVVHIQTKDFYTYCPTGRS